MQKDTSEILKELQLCTEFKTFYDENKEYLVQKNLAELLEELVKKHDLKKTAIVHAAEMSEVYAYQIFSGARMPDRKKLLCLAIAMKLSLDEIQVLLRCAGYSPLYVKIPFDSVVLYGICNKLAIVQINQILYGYGLETLG